MRTVILSLIATSLVSGLPRVASAADMTLIANSNVKAAELSETELRDIFLGEKATLEDGSHVVPVTLADGAAHGEILKIVGKTDPAFRAFWRKQVFVGKAAMPRMFPTDAAMEKYVAATPGAVGYITAGEVPAGVKVLKIK